MATIVASGPLGRKISASCWGLGSKAIFWSLLLICIGVSFACGCFSLFTCRFGVSSFSFFVNYNLLFLNKKLDIWQVTVCTIHPWFHSRVTSNAIPPWTPSLIAKWPETLVLLVAGSWGLVAFFFWRQLMISLSLELSTRSLSLSLNMLDNGTTSSCNSSPRPNACFNTRFCNIVKIFSFLLARFFAQVLPIRI